MNLQQHFDIKRFAILFKNDLLLNYKSYLLGATGFFIIYYLFLLLSMTSTSRIYDQSDYLSFFFFGVFALCVFVGSSFPSFSSKSGTFSYIMLPASTLEKFSLQFIIRFVFGIVFFLVTFWLVAHLARLTALQIESVKRSGVFIDSFNFAMLFDGITGLKHKIIIYITAFTIGLTLFSFRLFFKKLALLKSIVILFVFAFILLFITNILSNLFFPLTSRGFFSINAFNIMGDSFLLGAKGNITALLLFGFLLILPLGYFKLKEKQI